MNEKEIIKVFYDQMWNKWDFDCSKKILSPDIIFRGSLGFDVNWKIALENGTKGKI